MATGWSRRKKILVLIAAVVAVPMVVILPGVFWELHQANKALQTFGSAIEANQYRQAYELTTTELQDTADFATFQKTNESMISRFGNLQRIEVSSSKVENQGKGWYGYFEVSLVFSRGASVPFSFVLKKQGDSWKIYNYREL
jgi:hypothetical protein